jgi:hypothetical protein
MELKHNLAQPSVWVDVPDQIIVSNVVSACSAQCTQLLCQSSVTCMHLHVLPLTSPACESCTVTHSSQNRKRSSQLVRLTCAFA